MKKKVEKGIVLNEKSAESPSPLILHTCKNCGYLFEGNFCPSCGQSVAEVQKPIKHFLGDLLGSVFALDIRLIRSVPVLLFRPGKLSSEYIDGKRASHVAPFRLYFFASLVFFFLIGWQTKSAINKAEGERSGLNTADSIVRETPGIQVGALGDTMVSVKNIRDGLGLFELVRKESMSKLEDTTLTVKEREARRLKAETLKDPEVAISKIYQYFSWSLFLLMPLFAFILYGVFRKKRRFYVEHLIYSVNLHTFFFMIAIGALLLSIVFPALLNKIGGLIFLFTVVYSVLGIRNFYKTRWVSAILSSLAIFIVYFFCVIFVLLAGVILFVS